MASDHRSTALDRLRTLRERLQDGVADAAAGEECDHVIRAVEAFHPEGVRFRMYGLRRRLTAGDTPAADELVQLLDDARDALRAAGFKTR